MLTATDLAAAVRAGELGPVDVTECALARILSGDGAIGAFRRVRTEEAVVEARALRERPDFRGATAGRRPDRDKGRKLMPHVNAALPQPIQLTKQCRRRIETRSGYEHESQRTHGPCS